MAKYTANPVEVNAYVITDVGPLLSDGSRWLSMDGNPDSLASAEMMSRMTPAVGDYLVVQSDGYVYLNPKAVFERKYSLAWSERPKPTIDQLEKILQEPDQHLEVLPDGTVREA